MRELIVGGQVLLVARVAGRYYAAQGRCPHMGGRLADGKLQGQIVTCPLHGSTFDVTTGAVVAWIVRLPGLVRSLAQVVKKPTNLATYPAKVEDEQVWVRL